MKVGTMVKSAVALTVVGTAMYMYSNSSARTKRRIKKTTEKALDSIGNTFNGISSMM